MEWIHYAIEVFLTVVVTILGTILTVVWHGKADAGETAVAIASLHGKLEAISTELTNLHADFRIYTQSRASRAHE